MADGTTFPSYSIAIRTLGTAGELFRKELVSICSQTVQPEQVLVYIAEGYDRPDFTVGREEYVWVKKGMMSQRILPYDEISSDCILMLDDDVFLAPNSAEKMLVAQQENEADCVGADVFKNHEMTLRQKAFAALSNMIVPHWGHKWAFKMLRNGSFSYNNHPVRSFYWSQTCGGPAMMWKKDSLLRLHLEDEFWLEHFGFAYGDDAVETYKLYLNGGRLGVLYDSGIENRDAKTSSASFRKSPDWMYNRTKASLMIWWRTCYRNGKDSFRSRILAALAFGIKGLCVVPVICLSALIYHKGRWILDYFKGLSDGCLACRKEAFMRLPPYVFNPRRE